MGKYTSEQQEEIIDELGKRLHEGSRLFREAKAKQYKSTFAPWIMWWFISWHPAEKSIEACKKWYQETLEYLENKYPQSVYSNQFENVLDDIIPNEEEGRNTRFLKTFQKRITALEKIIYALKEEVVLSNKIAKTTKMDNSAYTLTFDIHSHEIKVNGMIVTKVRSFLENEQVIEYLVKHPNKIIETSEIETALNIKITKSPVKIVTELGFSGNMRKMFFPSNTKTTIMLKNPITEEYITEHHLPRLKIS